MERTMSAYQSKLWSLLMCIFRVGRSLSFVGAWSTTVGLSCYASDLSVKEILYL